MKLLEVHDIGDGRLAWFALTEPPLAPIEVMLHVTPAEAQVCFYPGWSGLNEEQQKEVAVELLTERARPQRHAVKITHR